MKRKLALILAVSLMFCFGALQVTFAAESTTVTTGADLQAALETYKGGTVTIEGEETLADGTTGIILPDDYTAVTGFYGTITGVDGKNNIQLAETAGNEHGLIANVGTNTTIENLVIKGAGSDGKGTITAQTDSYGGTAPLIGYISGSGKTVTISNIVNYVNVNAASGLASGAVGYINYGTLSITNYNNYGNITGTTKSGGLLAQGRRSSSTVTITNSFNYGNITGNIDSTSSFAGGLYGGYYSSSDCISLTITSCANYGDVTAYTAGGLAGSGYKAAISKSFNYGTVEGNRYAGGLAGNTSATATIENSFNAGNITINAAYVACGIARGAAVVTSCYNVGEYTSSLTGKYFYGISDSTTEGSENNYYIENDKLKTSGQLGTQVSLDDLKSPLPDGFSSEVWEYNTDGTNYPYPQIKGNTFTAPEGSFIEPSTDIIVTTGEDLQAALEDCAGETVIIEGEETLADGTTGIIVPDEYYPIQGFYGTIRGVDGKNNIQLAETAGSEKALINYVAAGTTVLDNLVIKGAGDDGKGTITVQTNSSYDSAAALIGYIGNSGADVTISNIDNYVSVNATTAYAASAVGYINNGTLEITNYNNYGNVATTGTYAAGFIAAGRKNTSAVTAVTVQNSSNYGNVTAQQQAGGIFGNDYSESQCVSLTITGCANFGAIGLISGGTNGSWYAGGIAGKCFNAAISGCLNAGTVTGLRYASGILGNAADSSATAINNCFNVGKLATTYAGAQNIVYGIAKGTNAVVTRCYNTGIYEYANIGNHVYYQITNSANASNAYNYQVKDSGANGYITVSALAAALPEGFSSEVWEYNTDGTNYVLPQLKEITLTVDLSGISAAAGESIYSSGENEVYLYKTALDFLPITTSFRIAKGSFALPNGLAEEEVEYGMLISKTLSGTELTAANCDAAIPALKNINGAYGILFYGNIIEGDVYNLRPYVKLLRNNSYTYGDAVSFGIAEE